jgi:hypothetical protein
MEQVREHQSRRSSADDSNLRSHRLNENYSPSIEKNIALGPIDLADMGRSNAAPLHNCSNRIAGALLALDVTIAVRWQSRPQTEHGKCLHL